MEPLRWILPHDVHVAMSLAVHGDLRDADRRQAWCRRWSLPEPTVLRQVHGALVLRADVATAEVRDGDGLVAAPGDRAIGVFGADCPPLVLATPDAIGVAHCGWRGTAAGMVAALAEALRTCGSGTAAAWTGLVGPGVHPDDYEVDAPVLAARRWPAGCLRHGRPGRAWLDLPAVIAADAAACGVASCARSAVTTSRDRRLRSHRRDGPGHPQLLVAWRAPCAG